MGVHGDGIAPRLEVSVRGRSAVVYVRAVGLNGAWCDHDLPLLLRRAICGEELAHQSLRLGVGRELAGLGPARIAGRTVLADRLGDVAGEMVWSASFAGRQPGRAHWCERRSLTLRELRMGWFRVDS